MPNRLPPCQQHPHMKSSPLTISSTIYEIPFINKLDSNQLEALKFGLGSIFLGTSGGLLFGGVTTLMRGLQDTPAGRANLLRSFKLFSNKTKSEL